MNDDELSRMFYYMIKNMLETVVQLSKGSIPSQGVKVDFSMSDVDTVWYLAYIFGNVLKHISLPFAENEIIFIYRVPK